MLRGSNLTRAALTASLVTVGLAVGVAACYRAWARHAWGAPFLVGERVRVVHGPNAGSEGVVVALDQAQQPEVELLQDGMPARSRFRWSQLRRIDEAQASGVGREAR